MKYLLVTLLVLSGCGKGLVPPAADHGAFEGYFQAFESASREFGRATEGDSAVSIGFGKPSGELAGACNVSWGQRSIVIDPEQWMQLTKSDRKTLIFHELGHCLLNRSHVTSWIEVLGVGEEPSSIMYPIVGHVDIDSNPSYYLKELFD